MAETAREPHSVSLKVLRLSRPTLAQNPPLTGLSESSDLAVQPRPSAHVAGGDSENSFILGRVLTLPPTFGAAFVGQTFSCTLCANNELQPDAERQISIVKVGAEMRCPSGTTPLDAMPKDESLSSGQLQPGGSLQRIVQFDLREEGPHTLAVNVSYSETTISKDQAASGGRARSFSKLYQFPARPCLNVRTKISPFPHEDPLDVKQLALEAQLDNVGDGPVTLQAVTFAPKPTFKSTSLNWDNGPDGNEVVLNRPILSPRDVVQVAFLIEAKDDGPTRELTRDGRIVLGQLSIQWRTAMGETGFLSTGWLTTKRR